MINTVKAQVMNLWKLCFDDSDEFIELYFKLRFNNNVNIYIESGSQVISALQVLPYPFTFYGTEFQSSYISGACTHPEYRNRGVMKRLIAETFARMSSIGVTFATLIPAEDWLYDYYGKLGFASVFEYASRSLSDEPVKSGNSRIEYFTDYNEDVYNYLNSRLHRRDCCVQHTKEDFKVVMADMKIDRGTVVAAFRDSNVVGEAFVYQEENVLYVVELLYDTNRVKQELIHAVKQLNPDGEVQYFSPVGESDQPERHGMIRIINVPKVLQLYATYNPNLIMNIIVDDPMLSSNNSYYYLYKGKCMVSKEKLPGRHVTLTMAELAELVFKDKKPFMSLMMD